MIYTSIFGNIDPPRIDVLCLGTSNRMNAKVYKVLSHLFTPPEPTLWVDGNIFPLIAEGEILSKMLCDADLALFRHPFRKNPLEEARELVVTKSECSGLFRFVEYYGEAYLSALPLYECGILARRPTEATRRFNEIWWNLISKWSVRDQVTCPIAIAESRIKINVIEANIRHHRMFRYVEHAK